MKKFTTLICDLLACGTILAQTQGAGKIAIEGYNDDGTDGLASLQAGGAPQKASVASQSARTAGPTATRGPSRPRKWVAPKPAKAFLPTDFRVAGDRLTALFDAKGCLVSLKAAGTDSELAATAEPFVEVTLKGKQIRTNRLRRAPDGGLVFGFPGAAGEVTVLPIAAGGGLVFVLSKSSVGAADKIAFARVRPACGKYFGTFLNGCSDDEHAVVLRGFERATDSRLRDGLLSVTAEAAHGLTGWSAGLAAARRGDILARLKEMTRAAGVPMTDAGGAWSLGSDGARQSYLFATVLPNRTDWWIDLAELGGFSILHFSSSWTSAFGHYALNPKYYPNGLADMKPCVERIHAAGLKTGLHTLTACVTPTDPWVTPLCSTNLYADATYTLAKPLGDKDDEVVVNELPCDKHDLVFTYLSNGNALRIGHELIQYSAIRREKPYAFTGLTRGAFGTVKGDHAAGERCDYLHQRYIAFYPDPDSPLADELATYLAATYNACGHDEIYFDGSEGMGSRYGIDAMRWKIADALDKKPGAPAFEASCRGANNWWFQSRTGTTDHPVWGAKRFHDLHVADAEQIRRAEFLEPQMGWWQPRRADPRVRGHFLDEMEYFASKNAGLDAAMSLQGINREPPTTGIRAQLTVLGWYERLRLARAFDPSLQAEMAVPGKEFRLRQDGAGRWTVRPVEYAFYRSVSPESREKTLLRKTAAPLALRIESLYGAGAYDEAGAQEILSAADLASASSEAAKGVKVEVGSGTGEGRAVKGATIVLKARNESAPQKGAWARVKKTIPLPYLDLKGKSAFGLWVKGDGSGALLKLQLVTGREYTESFSDHDLRLDFTGWRYFSFLARERDVEDFRKYVWPYGRDRYAIYRYKLDSKHVGSVALYLNDIPVGKRAEVAVSSVKALSVTRDVSASDVSVTVNGTALKLPFAALKGGDYAELEDGRWTRYSEIGEPLETVRTGDAVSFAAGANRCRVAAREPGARLEATFVALGAVRPALKAGFDCAAAKALAVEAMFPVTYAPAKGFGGAFAVAARPNETARLQLTVSGPVKRPALVRAGTSERWEFPVDLAAGERLVCRGDRHWRRLSAIDDTLLSEGDLEKPLPPITGTVSFALSSSAPAEATARIDLVKRYE